MVDYTISKRRRHDVQELQKGVADEFRRWMVGKKPDSPLWPGWWWNHAADMLKVDLKAAGIEFRTPGGVIDFHAVGRVQFITQLVSTAAPLALVQRIARFTRSVTL
jgi:hypothetical protein